MPPRGTACCSIPPSHFARSRRLLLFAAIRDDQLRRHQHEQLGAAAITISGLNDTAYVLAIHASWNGSPRPARRTRFGAVVSLTPAGNCTLRGSLTRFQLITSSLTRLPGAPPPGFGRHDLRLRRLGARQRRCLRRVTAERCCDRSRCFTRPWGRSLIDEGALAPELAVAPPARGPQAVALLVATRAG
jgi:hypothetical protein